MATGVVAAMAKPPDPGSAPVGGPLIHSSSPATAPRREGECGRRGSFQMMSSCSRNVDDANPHFGVEGATWLQKPPMHLAPAGALQHSASTLHFSPSFAQPVGGGMHIFVSVPF